VADSTVPYLLTVSPADGQGSIAKSVDIRLTFDDDMAAGTGDITLSATGGNQASTDVVIAVGDSQVTFESNEVIINPSAAYYSNGDLDDRGDKTWSVLIPSGVLVDTSTNAFSGVGAGTYSFKVRDSTNPVLLGYDPLVGELDVHKAKSITLTFNELMKCGATSAPIVLTPTGGNQANTVVSIPSCDSSQVTFSGTQVIVNPSADLDDRGTKTYTVTMANAAITDDIGNPWPGLPRGAAVADSVIIPGAASSGPYGTVPTYNFTVVDYSAPFITSYLPAINAQGVLKSDDIVLTFNEDVQLGTDSTAQLVLTPSGGNGIDQSTYPDCPVPASYSYLLADSTQVSVVGTVLTLSPASNWSDCLGKEYTVTLPVGALRDTVGNDMTGILTATGAASEGDDARGILAAAPRAGTFAFFVPDATSPFIVGYAPAVGERNVLEGVHIVITYSEGVTLGSGNITITQEASTLTAEAVHEVVPVTDSSRVTISSTTLTINPTANLIPGKGYQVTLDAGAVTDLVVTAQNGGVAPNPSLLLNGSAYSFVVLAKLRLQFTENVAISAGSGKFIFVEATSGTTTTVAATDASQVSFTSEGVVLRPVLPTLASGQEYTLIVGEYVMDEPDLGTHAGSVLDVYPDSEPFLLQFRPYLAN